jgi:serine/threonine protein kinase/TPR repeat protein
MKQYGIKEDETQEVAGAAFYQSGVDAEIKKAYKEAELFYRKAIEKEHIGAHCQLALLYLKEHISDSFWKSNKKKEAKELLIIAAEKGHPQAMLNLAYQLTLGDGIKEEFEGAMKWYNRYLSADTRFTLLPAENSAGFIDLRLKLLFATLENNNTLSHLNLSGIPITPVSAAYLADALKYNHTLIDINLSYCQLNDKAIHLLSKALRDKNCKTLLRLDLTGNTFGISGQQDQQHIEQCLRLNQHKAAQLVEACCKKELTEIERLFGEGVSPYVTDSNGNTVFHWAAWMENVDLMQRLLKRCPDINLRLLLNGQQLSPINIAKGLENSEMIALLAKHMGSLPSLLSVVPDSVSVPKPASDPEPDPKPTPDSKPTPDPASTPKPSPNPVSIPPRQSSAYLIPFEDIKWQRDIGEGHYAVVFAGIWRGHTTVAVKKLRMQHLSSEALEEFYREAAVMEHLQTPRVVQLYGICKEPYCFVMEYMEKGSLFMVLRSEPTLDWPLRQRIGFDIACGLDFLHTAGVLHRDLKSLNVLLDSNYRAKLADFGLSKIKAESRTSSSKRQTVGTCAWSGPEILQPRDRGEKIPYSPQSDMYSYGMVLWEIASKKTPFSDAESDMQICHWVVNRGTRETIPDDTPELVAKLIQACWDADPKKRPLAADAVKQLRNEEVLSPAPMPRQANLSPVSTESYGMYASDFSSPYSAGNGSPYFGRSDSKTFFRAPEERVASGSSSSSTVPYEMYASDFSRTSYKK